MVNNMDILHYNTVLLSLLLYSVIIYRILFKSSFKIHKFTFIFTLTCILNLIDNAVRKGRKRHLNNLVGVQAYKLCKWSGLVDIK